jgi:hypothetical protein
MSETRDELIISYLETAIWITYPTTIMVLQSARGGDLKPIERAKFYERNRGINATIILLSALTIEGFLVECLSSYAVGYRFSDENTFEGRLDHDFLTRISTATFGDFPELFRLTLGKPLSECITDKTLLDSVRILIKFRNRLAHARSVVYAVHDYEFRNIHGDIDGFTHYEMENQYREIHEYLEKKRLVFDNRDLFKNDIADHFTGLVKPYIDAVIPLLPVPQSDYVKTLVASAFRTSIT